MFETQLSGSMVALVTPMHADGSIDIAAWSRLLQLHAQAGTDAVVVSGTTGEGACLQGKEVTALLRTAVEHFGPHGAVVAGIGSAATAQSLHLLSLAQEARADAVLAVTPYYNKPPQQGLVAHYRSIADAASVPVLLYNVPARTGVDLLPETVAELSTHECIIGLKEANATAGRLPALQALLEDDFLLLSGDDNSCCDSMLHGAHGVVSVAANLVPAQFARMVAAARAGDFRLANSLRQALQPLFDTLNAISNPIAIKWALASVGQIDSGIRLPLIWMPADLQHQHLPVVEAAWERDQALLATPNNSG
jgi:4-hydroxy-tetrahydrodipicolinate synthase